MTRSRFKQLEGCRVCVHRILAAKPQWSDVPGWGYIFNDAEFDPNQREDCDAVGQVGFDFYRDGIVVVDFITPDWWNDPNYRMTCAFAHIDDIEQTDAGYVFPTNYGLVMKPRTNHDTI